MSRTRDQTALQQPPRANSSERANPEHVLDAYRAEFDYVCRSLVRLGVRDADIEDMAHEVFVVLCRKWNGFDRSRQLRPYLFGIAFRVAAAHRRRYGREVAYDGTDIADGARNAEQEVWSTQARAMVLRALEQIKLSRRAVLIMYELDEVPMAMIAKTLGIPLFTAYSRLRKARKEFKIAIEVVQSEGNL